jgi:hypothetical protein
MSLRVYSAFQHALSLGGICVVKVRHEFLTGDRLNIEERLLKDGCVVAKRLVRRRAMHDRAHLRTWSAVKTRSRLRQLSGHIPIHANARWSKKADDHHLSPRSPF